VSDGGAPPNFLSHSLVSAWMMYFFIFRVRWSLVCYTEAAEK